MLTFLSNLAKSIEYSNGICTVDGVVQSTTDQCVQAGKLAAGIFAGILIPILIIGAVLFIFWILALVHLFKHKNIPNYQTWLIVLILGFFLGYSGIAAVVYYFAVMRPMKKGTLNTTPSSPQTPRQAPALTLQNSTETSGSVIAPTQPVEAQPSQNNVQPAQSQTNGPIQPAPSNNQTPPSTPQV